VTRIGIQEGFHWIWALVAMIADIRYNIDVFAFCGLEVKLR
jgi:hypothetical protein